MNRWHPPLTLQASACPFRRRRLCIHAINGKYSCNPFHPCTLLLVASRHKYKNSLDTTVHRGKTRENMMNAHTPFVRADKNWLSRLPSLAEIPLNKIQNNWLACI
jgi:hypothetical protein